MIKFFDIYNQDKNLFDNILKDIRKSEFYLKPSDRKKLKRKILGITSVL